MGNFKQNGSAILSGRPSIFMSVLKTVCYAAWVKPARLLTGLFLVDINAHSLMTAPLKTWDYPYIITCCIQENPYTVWHIVGRSGAISS
jgi:hypothetical protein